VTGIITIIETVIEKIGKAVAWLMIPLTLTLVYEVILRYGLGKPTVWSFDVTYMICSVFVVMGLSYALQAKAHVSVDILFNKFSKRTQSIFNILFYTVLLFPCLALIISRMVPHILRSWRIGEIAVTGTWLPPIYPFKTWVLIGIILLLLQGVSELLKNIKLLTDKETG